MGILNNGFRDSYGTFRFCGGGISNGAAPASLASQYHLTGAQRNRINADDGAFPDETHSVPDGVRHPYTWIMAQKNGRMSARITGMTLDTTAQALMGYPISGEIDISITIPNADGQAVASGTGTASLSIVCSDLTLTSSINGDGTASFTITGGTTTLGALAGIEGSAPISVTGTLDLKAWGLMEGTTEESGLTPSGIANAVWSALAAANNDSGTMGEKLNGAGSAGNPWTEIIESGYSAAEILRIVAASLAGKVSGADTASITFKGLDGTTDRISATVDTNGNRLTVTLDGN